jgi:hypothetical protein
MVTIDDMCDHVPLRDSSASSAGPERSSVLNGRRLAELDCVLLCEAGRWMEQNVLWTLMLLNQVQQAHMQPVSRLSWTAMRRDLSLAGNVLQTEPCDERHMTGYIVLNCIVLQVVCICTAQTTTRFVWRGYMATGVERDAVARKQHALHVHGCGAVAQKAT